MNLLAKLKHFDEITVSNAAFDKQFVVDFGIRATGIMICVDGAGYVEYSFNCKDRHGKVYESDAFVAFDNIDEQLIYFRAPSSVSIRVWAWLEQK